MLVDKTTRTRRNADKQSSSYYQNLCQELTAKDQTESKHADNTKKSKKSLLKKWNKSVVYCTLDQSKVLNLIDLQSDFVRRLNRISKAFS